MDTIPVVIDRASPVPLYHQLAEQLTAAIESGRLFETLGVPALDPAHDRVMICGGPQVLVDLQNLLDARGFEEGTGGKPASYVIEKAFAER